MKKLVNDLRGWVRVEAVGAFPERLLNLCAQNGVEFWAVEWRDECTVCLTLRRCGEKKLEGLARRIGFTLSVCARGGLPELVRSLRGRYAFLAGLALSLCAVSLLSHFVLTVEISGNDQVPRAVILQQLRRFGVYPGAWGPGLDRRQIEQEILLAQPELSWMTINLHGTRAEVLVRERTPAPERIDETGFYHVIAGADGMVERVEGEQGEVLVEKGDIVAKGDILISGTVTMLPPLYTDYPVRYFDTHARGRVWCRTWRDMTAVIPLETTLKAETGRSKTVWAINFFGKRTEIFGNSSILDGDYDKITSVRQLCLPGGGKLPVWLIREDYREYVPEQGTVQLAPAQELLEEQLAGYFARLAGPEGTVCRVDSTARVDDGLLCVTAEGECLEEIGQEVPAQ